jgi:HlyD family secretion protein
MTRRLPALLAFGLLAGCASNADWHRIDRARVERTAEATGQLVSADTAVLMPPVVKNVWNLTIAFMAPEGSQVQPGMPVLGFNEKQRVDQLQLRRGELDEKRKDAERTALTGAQRARDDELELARLESEAERARRKAEQPAEGLASLEYRKLQIDRDSADAALELFRRKLALATRARGLERELLQSEIQRLDLEVQRLEAEIARLKIAAPRAGLVIHREDWNRNKLAVGQQVWLGQEIMEIPDLTRMRARVQVPEREAAHVAVGQTVRITLEAARNRVFTGRVVDLGQVFRSKSRNQPAVVFDAEIEIDDVDAELMRPGMAVTAQIVTRVDEGALRIPRRAVSLQQGRPVAWRRGLLGEEAVELRLAAQVGDWFVVETGLAEGDRVRL